MHDDLVRGEAKVESNGLRDEGEKLSGGEGRLDNPLVIQSKSEGDLDRRRIIRLC